MSSTLKGIAGMDRGGTPGVNGAAGVDQGAGWRQSLQDPSGQWGGLGLGRFLQGQDPNADPNAPSQPSPWVRGLQRFSGGGLLDPQQGQVVAPGGPQQYGAAARMAAPSVPQMVPAGGGGNPFHPSLMQAPPVSAPMPPPAAQPTATQPSGALSNAQKWRKYLAQLGPYSGGGM